MKKIPFKTYAEIIKPFLILALVIVSLIYMRPEHETSMTDSERATYQWVTTHPQPIHVHTIGDHNYLLIDSKGETFITGTVNFGTITKK